MTHNISLITTLAAGFGLALPFGFIAERIKLPAVNMEITDRGYEGGRDVRS